MRRKSFDGVQCPLARTLDRVGDWWSLLILRDAMFGLTRFDEFRESLSISPNILSRRLKQLVASGILERSVSEESPVRVEYRLSSFGRDFEPLLLYFHTFGNAHFAAEGKSAVVVNRATGKATDLAIVDRNTGKEARWSDFAIVPGPAAKQITIAKLNDANERLAAAAQAPKRKRAVARAKA